MAEETTSFGGKIPQNLKDQIDKQKDLNRIPISYVVECLAYWWASLSVDEQREFCYGTSPRRWRELIRETVREEVSRMAEEASATGIEPTRAVAMPGPLPVILSDGPWADLTMGSERLAEFLRQCPPEFFPQARGIVDSIYDIRENAPVLAKLRPRVSIFPGAYEEGTYPMSAWSDENRRTFLTELIWRFRSEDRLHIHAVLDRVAFGGPSGPTEEERWAEQVVQNALAIEAEQLGKKAGTRSGSKRSRKSPGRKRQTG